MSILYGELVEARVVRLEVVAALPLALPSSLTPCVELLIQHQSQRLAGDAHRRRPEQTTGLLTSMTSSKSKSTAKVYSLDFA